MKIGILRRSLIKKLLNFRRSYWPIPRMRLILLEKIVKMCRNGTSAVQMGENAKKDVIRICDENTVLRKYIDLYQSLSVK